MNIRKHWKKILLSIATLFWVGCNDEDNATVAPVIDSSAEAQPNDSVESGSSETDISSGVLSSSDIASSSSEYSSSSDYSEICADTSTFPYVVASTGVRCREPWTEKDTLGYICCNHTRISKERFHLIYSSNGSCIGNVQTSWIADTVPGHLVNDTLYTKLELDKRSEELEEARRLALQQKKDSLAYLCVNHGENVSDFSSYSKYVSTVDSYECRALSSNTAVDSINAKLDAGGLSEKVKTCLEKLRVGLGYIENECVALYGTPSANASYDSDTVSCGSHLDSAVYYTPLDTITGKYGDYTVEGYLSVGSVTCIDGATIETEEEKALKEKVKASEPIRKENEEACANDGRYQPQIDDCLKQDE